MRRAFASTSVGIQEKASPGAAEQSPPTPERIDMKHTRVARAALRLRGLSLLLLVATQRLNAQAASPAAVPITTREVESMLKAGMSETRVLQVFTTRCLSAAVTSAEQERLVGAGASRSLLDALAQHICRIGMTREDSLRLRLDSLRRREEENRRLRALADSVAEMERSLATPSAVTAPAVGKSDTSPAHRESVLLPIPDGTFYKGEAYCGGDEIEKKAKILRTGGRMAAWLLARVMEASEFTLAVSDSAHAELIWSNLHRERGRWILSRAGSGWQSGGAQFFLEKAASPLWNLRTTLSATLTIADDASTAQLDVRGPSKMEVKLGKDLECEAARIVLPLNVRRMVK